MAMNMNAMSIMGMGENVRFLIIRAKRFWGLCKDDI